MALNNKKDEVIKEKIVPSDNKMRYTFLSKFRLKRWKYSTFKIQIKLKNKEKWSKFGVWQMPLFKFLRHEDVKEDF
jgi:hypothetical protein